MTSSYVYECFPCIYVCTHMHACLGPVEDRIPHSIPRTGASEGHEWPCGLRRIELQSPKAAACADCQALSAALPSLAETTGLRPGFRFSLQYSGQAGKCCVSHADRGWLFCLPRLSLSTRRNSEVGLLSQGVLETFHHPNLLYVELIP